MSSRAALRLPRRRLTSVYERLLAAYRPQHWWPADSPFEVMVGAVLTQNAAWTNVERALANLKRHHHFSAKGILDVDQGQLAEWLRPSGYFNIKARRLRNFCEWYSNAGALRRLRGCDTDSLRHQLLRVNGIGPETADDILLYAFERPVFVIDAYTRRLFSRLGLIAGNEGYETLRHAFERALGPDTKVFNEYHALIVRHAKVSCRVRPLCPNCKLRRQCQTGKAG
jgi:endonuclease-3 related protein